MFNKTTVTKPGKPKQGDLTPKGPAKKAGAPIQRPGAGYTAKNKPAACCKKPPSTPC